MQLSVVVPMGLTMSEVEPNQLVVVEVEPGNSAKGVRVGSFLKTLNGQIVTTLVQFQGIIDNCKAQAELSVELVLTAPAKASSTEGSTEDGVQATVTATAAVSVAPEELVDRFTPCDTRSLSLKGPPLYALTPVSATLANQVALSALTPDPTWNPSWFLQGKFYNVNRFTTSPLHSSAIAVCATFSQPSPRYPSKSMKSSWKWSTVRTEADE